MLSIPGILVNRLLLRWNVLGKVSIYTCIYAPITGIYSAPFWPVNQSIHTWSSAHNRSILTCFRGLSICPILSYAILQ